MNKLLLAIAFTIFSSSLFAQKAVYEHYNFTYAGESGVSVPSFMYSQTLTFGKNQQFRIGSGVRISGFWATNKGFSSNAKTLTIRQTAQTTAINIPIIFEIHGKKWLAGANVDFIGFSFGGTKDSLSVSNYSGKLDSLSASPVSLNFLGTRSGTINSEIYVGFKPRPELTIRAGVSFISSQYSTNYYNSAIKDYADFDKFRYQAKAIPFISIVFNFEK